jgi:lysophospholipase L1-like esterase
VGDIGAMMIGDSIFERFAPNRRRRDTGSHTKLGQAAFPWVFNAGVGGDRIANLLYRIVRGLLKALHGRGVSTAIVHIGTNDLKPQRALSEVHIRSYALLIAALQRECPGINILVIGLMPRHDVSQQCINDSNRALQQLVAGFEGLGPQGVGLGKVSFMPPITSIGRNDLIDHVHLNRDAYSLVRHLTMQSETWTVALCCKHDHAQFGGNITHHNHFSPSQMAGMQLFRMRSACCDGHAV